jgi:hypothetical protein
MPAQRALSPAQIISTYRLSVATMATQPVVVSRPASPPPSSLSWQNLNSCFLFGGITHPVLCA